MRLYILRHGQAEAHAKTDEARRLTERGKVEVTAIAKQHLSTVGLRRIISSPYVRARETAEAVRQSIGFEPQVETWDLISPEGEPATITKLLSEGPCDRSVLVSHQPLVGLLVSYLTEGHFQSPAALGTANLAVLEFDEMAPGMATLAGVYQPD